MKKFLIVLAMVVTASLLMGAGCFIVNTPPVITTTPGNTAIVGIEYTYTITATDPDGDPITYSLVSGPTDMIFDGVATISWTPTVEQVGAHDVTVEANDGEEGTTQSFTITVIPVSVAPTLTTIASPQIAYYGEVFTYTVVATAGTDPDLTFSLPVAPTMMSIVPATGVISWIPIADQLGYNDVTVKVTAADGLSDEVSFIVEVREPVPPEVELTSIAVLPEAMTLIVGDSETIILVTATYDDESTAVVSLGDCTYLSSDVAVATVLAGVVTAVAEGTSTITIRYGDESDTLAVTVSEPEPEPVLELTGIVVDPETMTLFVGGSEAIESVTATYEIRGTEVPIALEECTFTSSAIEFATVSDAGLVTAVAEGTATITVGYGDEFDTLAVTVSAVEPEPNQAPVITSTAITSGKVGLTYTYDVNATDPDGDDLTYSLTEKPLGMAIVATTGVISWDPTDAGVFPVGVKVSDPDELFDVQGFSITVAEADEPEPEPELVLGWIEVDPKTMDLIVGGTELIVSVTATYEIRGFDVDIDLGDCLFLTSDSEVATVEEVGGVVTVTAVGEGTADIIVSYEGKTDFLVVTVNPVLVTSIAVAPDTMDFIVEVGVVLFVAEPGEWIIDNIEITANPTIGQVKAYYNFGDWEWVDLEDCSFSSSPLGIIVVDDDGLVTVILPYEETDVLTSEPLPSDHEITITVEYDDKTDTIDVTVDVLVDIIII